VRGNAFLAPALAHDDLAHRQNGAGSADHRLPAEPPVGDLDGLQLLACGDLGRAQRPGLDTAVREERRRVADAAHVQAFHVERVEVASEDELGTATADIHHQTLLRLVLEAVRHAEVDQARLLVAGDDVDGMAERALGTGDEIPGVARLAQRVGPDHAHGTARQVTHPLAELLEAGQRTGHGLVADVVVEIETGGKAHGLAHAVDDPEAVILGAGDDHVEAVRTEVDGCQGRVAVGVRCAHDLRSRVTGDAEPRHTLDAEQERRGARDYTAPHLVHAGASR
jgi:hypothetical protein